MHICQRRKVGAELSFSATAKVADRLFGHPCARMGVQQLRRPRFFLGFHESVACVVCISRAEVVPHLLVRIPIRRVVRLWPLLDTIQVVAYKALSGNGTL